ncbi:MAG: hypothetical protein ACRYG8_51595 [Janthinobacterium lividum]
MMTMDRDGLPSSDAIMRMIAEMPTARDVYDLFRNHPALLRGWKVLIASQGGALPGLTVNRDFRRTAVVRGAVASERVLVLDEQTV